jgi:glc operon protein GlcG
MKLPSRRTLTLEAAKAIAAGAEAEALKNGWKVVIAVVDDGGHLVHLVRLDGTQTSSVDTAIGKAQASMGFRRATRILEEMVNNGRTAFVTLEGVVAMQGGVPIDLDGELVGAVGVSGVKASDDEIIATAGVEALKRQLT